jgi:hypothetical protein
MSQHDELPLHLPSRGTDFKSPDSTTIVTKFNPRLTVLVYKCSVWHDSYYSSCCSIHKLCMVPMGCIYMPDMIIRVIIYLRLIHLLVLVLGAQCSM